LQFFLGTFSYAKEIDREGRLPPPNDEKFFFVSDVGMFGFGASRSWLGKVASFGNLRWVIF